MPTDPSAATGGARPSRRTFLTGAALTGVAVSAGSLASGSAHAAQPTPAAPNAATSLATCGLELDGVKAGGLQSVSGGAVVGKVFVSKKGKNPKKHVGLVSLEDISITAGTGMSKAFYEDVAALVRGDAPLYRGRITTRDGNGSVTSVRRFVRALFSEVEFPTVDASDTDAALMTVKISPLGYFADPKAGPQQPTPSTQTWRRNNFRLLIDGVDCSHVSRIQSIAIREPVPQPPIGGPGPPVYSPTKYSDLVITMPASAATSLYKWNERVLVDLKTDNRSGQLEFLSVTAGVLFRLKLFGLGIFRVEPTKISADSDDLPEVTASIFCERMSFSFDKNVVG
jgi:hypothetical protein